MILADALKKLETFCMDFEPCLKVHSLISVQHKSIKLGQMSTIHARMRMPFVTGKSGLNQCTDNMDLIRYKINHQEKTKS